MLLPTLLDLDDNGEGSCSECPNCPDFGDTSSGHFPAAFSCEDWFFVELLVDVCVMPVGLKILNGAVMGHTLKSR
jgi:hypothetical protein